MLTKWKRHRRKEIVGESRLVTNSLAVGCQTRRAPSRGRRSGMCLRESQESEGRTVPQLGRRPMRRRWFTSLTAIVVAN